MQTIAIKIRGIDDVISFIDSCSGIPGRAGVIWWLALGGLFLDAFSNSALSAGLGPMTRDLHLGAPQIALMTSFASWVAIAFNPIGGWMADRWGRIRPLVLAKLPNGYETDIGDSGEALSGGQRQAIALARALYGDPRLVLLDEPNANLDADGERQLNTALLQLKREGVTVVVVTHRQAVLSIADRVMMMRSGQIECFGTREQVETWARSKVRPAGPVSGNEHRREIAAS